MLTIQNTKMIGSFPAIAILVSILIAAQYSYAGSQTLPIWYNYSIAGKQAYQEKNYQLSQRYYLGALTELEKLAAKKKRLHLPNEQETELGVLYCNMSNAFTADAITLTLAQTKQFQSKYHSPTIDMGKAISDPSYLHTFKNNAEAQLADVKKLQDRQYQQSTEREHADLDRRRRMLAVYEVLLGSNSVPARLCRDSCKARQIDAAKYDAHHSGLATLFTPDPKTAEEGEWRKLKNQAVNAQLSKNYAEGARFWELALKEAEKFGSNDTRVAETLERLGTTESLYLGRFDQAETHLNQSLAIYEKTLGKNDTHVWHVLLDLENLYRVTGRKDDLQRIITRRQTMEK